jgi:hypothetical protein
MMIDKSVRHVRFGRLSQAQNMFEASFFFLRDFKREKESAVPSIYTDVCRAVPIMRDSSAFVLGPE